MAEATRIPIVIIKWLLRINGLILLCATVPIFFPPALMDQLHQLLGMGRLPQGPVVQYLARSCSMLYAAHGAVMLAVSSDVKRFWPLVALLGWIHVGLGGVLLATDLLAPMPWWWALCEGPPIAALGVVYLVLWKRAGGASA